MASLYRDKRGTIRVQWTDRNERQSIALGSMGDDEAQKWKLHIEHLLEVNASEEPPSSATTKWLQGVSDEMHKRLSKTGLVVSRETKAAERITLAKWIDTYIAERKDVKGATLITYRRAKNSLLEYFGKTKLLRDITPADAKRWRIWLATEGNLRNKKDKKVADATVRRATGKAKQFFAEAIARGLVASDPFAKLPSHVKGNKKNQFFVPAEWARRCIEEAPNGDWRTIIALARFGGLRCPSEVLTLKWTDVDLVRGTMLIRSSKTEHHDNGGVRICPIFPELRPYLEQAWDEAPEGAVYVVHQFGGRQANLRTRFTTIIKQAGLKPWPKLFQNLRATRETELIQKFPAPDAASWIGNSVPVAMEHYAMATDDNFERAKSEATSELRANLRALSSIADKSGETTEEQESPENQGDSGQEGPVEVKRNRVKWAVQNSNL